MKDIHMAMKSVWVILIVIAILFKIGAHMMVGGNNAHSSSPETVTKQVEEKNIGRTEKAGIPPMLREPSSQAAKSKKAAQMKWLPLSPDALRNRLSPAFSISPFVSEQGDVVRAKFRHFNIIGSVDSRSGRLTGVALVGPIDYAEDQVIFAAHIIQGLFPSSFVRNELVATMRQLVREASTVPGEGLMSTVEATNEQGLRISAMLNPDSREVILSIEPAEIYFHLNR